MPRFYNSSDKIFCTDSFWDNNLTWNTANPDFTLCFQQVLLVIVPSGIFCCIGIVSLITRWRWALQMALPWAFLNVTKMVLCGILLVISFAQLMVVIYQKHMDWSIPDVDVFAASIKFITFTVILVMMAHDRRTGNRSSYFLVMFWFTMTLCGILQFRSIILRAFYKTFAPITEQDYLPMMVYFPVVFVQLFLSLFPDKKIAAPLEEKSPFEEASLLSLLTFHWFNSIIFKGRKKLLMLEDFPPLPIKLNARYLWDKFEYKWLEELRRDELERSGNPEDNIAKTRSLPRLGRVLVESFWPWILLASLLQIIDSVTIFCAPLLLDKLLTFVSTDEYMWKGYLYCVLLFLSELVARLAYNFFVFFSECFALQLQNTVSSAIYRKALKLSSSSKREYGTGKIVNLVSVDVEKIYTFSTYCTISFGAPVKITLAIVFLWMYLGAACLAGIVVMVIAILISSFATNRINVLQVKQMEIKDLRLKIIAEILNGIKVLKLYAWELPFIKKISDIRIQEVNCIRSYQMFFAALSFVWGSLAFLVAIACFVTYLFISEKHVLDPNTIFVSINLLNTIRYAVVDVPELATDIVQVIVSLRRVGTFLSAEECNQDVGTSPNSGDVISIKNASLTWDKNDEPSLKNIELDVPKRSLVAVIGPVGSGKSSLLSAVLQEMYKTSGSIDVKGQIAYVPQQAWILNHTLRKNILFLLPFHESKYEVVLESCGLKPDLEILPAGDETEIGEKGVNLSGGQKQRVSVARAIYSNADVYLLDDPLSALDAQVGKSLFDQVIGKNGLLRNKSRILVTHNVAILSEVDLIVCMKDGRIVEKGTYSQLLRSGKCFSELIAEHSNVKLEGNLISSEITSLQNLTKRSISDQTYEKAVIPDSNEIIDAGKLTEEERMEIGEVKLSTFIKYCKLMTIKICCFMMLGYFCYVAFEVGGNLWLTKWSNDPKPINGTEDITLRNMRIGIYSALGLAQGISVVIGAVCLAFGTTKASEKVHFEMLESVMKAPMFFFDSTPVGRIMNRFGRDMDSIDTGIGKYIDGMAIGLFSTIGMFAVVGTNVPLILGFALPLGVLYYFVQKFYLITSRQLKRLSSTTRSPVYSHFTESILGTSSINAYTASDAFTRKLENKLDANCSCQFLWNACSRWLDFYFSVIAQTVLLWTCVFAVAARGRMDAAIVGLTITYAMSVSDVLTWLVRDGTELENQAISVERVDEYSQLTSEAAWRISDDDALWPLCGKIRFLNYSTRYRANLDLILKNVNLEIGENEKVGIVGRTGAGKSSFTLALFRIIEPVYGTIYIDDIDISEIGLHELRSNLTIIPQDPVLFTGTLRINLDPNENYSDEEVWSSLENSHLKTFVSTLPEGLTHEVAEGGSNLSVGQKQLICLARALLKKTKILILDEATAAVDIETDALIQNTIRTEFKYHTVITIAHRLNTILDYDKVIVMDAGSIVEVGRPTDLLRDPSSFFSRLAEDAALISSLH